MSDFKPINNKAASGKFICCDFYKSKKVNASEKLVKEIFDAGIATDKENR